MKNIIHLCLKELSLKQYINDMHWTFILKYEA